MLNPPVDISDERWWNDIHNALPAFMNQDPDSNNQKMLDIYSEFGIQYKNDILAITDQSLLQNANGKALDQLCNDWNVPIIDENDDEFKKFQLRFQIWRHRLGPGQMKGAIAFVFGIPTSTFLVKSVGVKAIKVVNVPFNFDTGDKTDLKKELITRYIREMMPPEFYLAGVEYQKYTDAYWHFAIWAEHTREPDVEQQPLSYSADVKHPLYVANASYQGINKQAHQKPMNSNKQVHTNVGNYGPVLSHVKISHQKPLNYSQNVTKGVPTLPMSSSGKHKNVNQQPMNSKEQVSTNVGNYEPVINTVKITHQQALNYEKQVVKNVPAASISSSQKRKDVNQSPLSSNKQVSKRGTGYVTRNISKSVTFERKPK